MILRMNSVIFLIILFSSLLVFGCAIGGDARSINGNARAGDGGNITVDIDMDVDGTPDIMIPSVPDIVIPSAPPRTRNSSDNETSEKPESE